MAIFVKNGDFRPEFMTSLQYFMTKMAYFMTI